MRTAAASAPEASATSPVRGVRKRRWQDLAAAARQNLARAAVHHATVEVGDGAGPPAHAPYDATVVAPSKRSKTSSCS